MQASVAGLGPASAADVADVAAEATLGVSAINGAANRAARAIRTTERRMEPSLRVPTTTRVAVHLKYVGDAVACRIFRFRNYVEGSWSAARCRLSCAGWAGSASS